MSDSNLAPPHHTIVAPLIAELGQFIADWACNTECSFDLSAVTTALDTIKSLDENNTDSLNTHKDIVQAYQEQWDTLHKVAKDFENYTDPVGHVNTTRWHPSPADLKLTLGRLSQHSASKQLLTLHLERASAVQIELKARNKTLDWWEKKPVRAHASRALAVFSWWFPLPAVFTRNVPKLRQWTQSCFRSKYTHAKSTHYTLEKPAKDLKRDLPDLESFNDVVSQINNLLKPCISIPEPMTEPAADLHSQATPTKPIATPRATTPQLPPGALPTPQTPPIPTPPHQSPRAASPAAHLTPTVSLPRTPTILLHEKVQKTLPITIETAQTFNTALHQLSIQPVAPAAAAHAPHPARQDEALSLNVSSGAADPEAPAAPLPFPSQGTPLRARSLLARTPDFSLRADIAPPLPPLFMQSATDLKTPDDLILHFTNTSVKFAATLVMNQLQTDFFSVETLTLQLLDGQEPAPDAVEKLQHAMTAIVTTFITTLLTQPHALEQVLKGSVTSTLLALLSLNQRDGRPLTPNFSGNLSKFIPELLLRLVRECVPVAKEMANKTCSSLTQTVEAYHNSIMADPKTLPWLQRRASQLKSSMADITRLTDELGVLLASALAKTPAGAAESLSDKYWQLFRLAFRGAKKDGHDEKTERFVTTYGLAHDGKADAIFAALGQFFHGLTPNAKTLKLFLKACWNLTSTDNVHRKMIQDINAKSTEFVAATQSFHAAWLTQGPLDNPLPSLTATTHDARVVSIYRIARMIFAINEDSTIETPNPEKTCDYIDCLLRGDEDRASVIALALRTDPIDFKDDALTVDRTCILQYITGTGGRQHSPELQRTIIKGLDKHFKGAIDLFDDYTTAEVVANPEDSAPPSSPYAAHSPAQQKAHTILQENLAALFTLQTDPFKATTRWSVALATSVDSRSTMKALVDHAYLLGGSLGRATKSKITKQAQGILTQLMPGNDGRPTLRFGNGLPIAYRRLATDLRDQYTSALAEHNATVAAHETAMPREAAVPSQNSSSLDALTTNTPSGNAFTQPGLSVFAAPPEATDAGAACTTPEGEDAATDGQTPIPS